MKAPKKRTTPDVSWELAAKRLNDGIRQELKRHFPRQKVDAFVRAVGAAFCAHDALTFVSEKERRDKLKNLSAAVRAFLRVGFEPVNAEPLHVRVDDALRVDPDAPVHVVGLTPWPSIGRAIVPPEPPDPAKQLYRARDDARRALMEYLVQIETCRGIAKSKPLKKPRADASGLLARIADRYLEILGEKPTSTEGERFSNIAVRVLENLKGKQQKDVSRPVKAALKAHRAAKKN